MHQSSPRGSMVTVDPSKPRSSGDSRLSAISAPLPVRGGATVMAELSNARTVRAEEIVLSVPDGRSVTTLINATPIRSGEGAVESVVVTMQDLAPLEELERLRSEFLGMVSHELRAPLTSIRGSTTSVLQSARPLDPAEMHQFFRIIDQQAKRMDALIGDLLDAGRIEAGTLSVAPEPAEVAALVEQARSTFLSGGARHRLKIELPPGLPRVMADERRIVQVLDNLLSNASRHSPETSPIRIEAAHDGVHVAISVTDEGRGLAPEVLPHLFRKYAGAGGGDAEPASGGYGLGLAICKGLVEAHGGRIRAQSGGPGQGTRFTFTLPVAGAAGPAAVPAPGRPDPAPDGTEPVRILVVDDDPITVPGAHPCSTPTRRRPRPRVRPPPSLPLQFSNPLPRSPRRLPPHCSPRPAPCCRSWKPAGRSMPARCGRP